MQASSRPCRLVKPLACAAALAALLGTAAQAATASPAAGGGAAPSTGISAPPNVGDEIIVTAEGRAAIRAALINAENRLFELYNSLNASDDFDIHCYQEPRVGSHIEGRLCKPNFVRKADRRYASALLLGLQGIGTESPEAAIGYSNYEMSRLVKDFNALLPKHPELLGAFIEVATLRNAQYADTLPTRKPVVDAAQPALLPLPALPTLAKPD